MPNSVGERGQPYFTPIVLRIGVEKPSGVLNLPSTFSYNLIIARDAVKSGSMGGEGGEIEGGERGGGAMGE